MNNTARVAWRIEVDPLGRRQERSFASREEAEAFIAWLRETYPADWLRIEADKP